MSFPFVSLKIQYLYINSCVCFTWFSGCTKLKVSLIFLLISKKVDTQNISLKFTRKLDR